MPKHILLRHLLYVQVRISSALPNVNVFIGIYKVVVRGINFSIFSTQHEILRQAWTIIILVSEVCT